MLAIAGQTAGPNWLTFFEGTHGYPGGSIGLKNSFFSRMKFFFQNIFQYLTTLRTS